MFIDRKQIDKAKSQLGDRNAEIIFEELGIYVNAHSIMRIPLASSLIVRQTVSTALELAVETMTSSMY